MGNAARIDDDYRVTGAGLTPHTGIRAHPEYAFPVVQMRRFETKLRAGLALLFTGERLPQAVEEAISRVTEFETLKAGWDSYGGRPLNDAVVEPAFHLIIQGCKMCQAPRLHLNGHGGIDLIWETADRYLLISTWPDETYEVYFEDRASGDEYEPDERVGLREALEQLRRFCSIQ